MSGIVIATVLIGFVGEDGTHSQIGWKITADEVHALMAQLRSQLGEPGIEIMVDQAAMTAAETAADAAGAVVMLAGEVP